MQKLFLQVLKRIAIFLKVFYVKSPGDYNGETAPSY